MKKLYSIICGKYRKIEKRKISHILEKAVLFCGKCKDEDEKIFKEQKSIGILKIIGLIESNYFRNMS